MIADTFREWRSRLERYCAQLLRNRHDAEEVVQDVFARLVATPDRYDLDRDPEVLLFRLARNRCIDTRRKRSPRSNAEVERVAAEPHDSQPDLEATLATLPEAERETLLLTAVDGGQQPSPAGLAAARNQGGRTCRRVFMIDFVQTSA